MKKNDKDLNFAKIPNFLIKIRAKLSVDTPWIKNNLFQLKMKIFWIV